MLCEFEKGGARLALQLIDEAVYVNGERTEPCGAAEFHRLYVMYRLDGWRELQVYL